jgi:hypothetical protein
LENERQKVAQQAQVAQFQTAAVQAEQQRLAQAAEIERQRMAAVAFQVRGGGRREGRRGKEGEEEEGA